VNLETKRVYDEPTPDEGTRILVMRLWPRGIRKSRVDAWYRELAPVLPLMRAFRSGKMTWSEYRRRYTAGLARPDAQEYLEAIEKLMKKGRVTIFCSCQDERRCHRGLLKSYLRRTLA
jgi:uncharacterized protein YeaO (DUF488 family)